MNNNAFMDLQFFAEEMAAAADAGGAETGTAAEIGTEGDVMAGEQLANGAGVSPQVAAAMNRQMKRHPELKQVYKAPRQAQPAQVQPGQQQVTEQQKHLQKNRHPQSLWKQRTICSAKSATS